MLNKTSGLSLLRNPSSFSFKKVKFRILGEFMQSKIRTHDGIVGATYMLSVILAAATSIQWLWVAGVVAGLQIISPVTKFCPVYFVLNKMMPDTDPIQNGQRN